MDFWVGIIEFGSASARLAARRPKYLKIVIFRFPVRRLVGGGGLILRLEHKITGLLRFGSPMGCGSIEYIHDIRAISYKKAPP